MRDANNTTWTVFDLVDDTHDGATSSHIIWLRFKNNIIFPKRPSSEQTPYALSELALNHPYLRASRDAHLVQVRINMGLTASPLSRTQQAILSLIVGSGILLILGLLIVSGSQVWIHRETIFIGPMYANLAWITLGTIIGGSGLLVIGLLWRLIRFIYQPPRTQEAIDTLERLLTDGRLIICKGQMKLAPRKYINDPYIEYQIDENDSATQYTLTDLSLSLDRTLKKDPSVSILVLYADGASHIVL